MGKDVGLVHEGELAAGTSDGARECVAHDSLDTPPGVDAFLGRDLLRRAYPQRPADSGGRPFCGLPYDHHVDVARCDICQRCLHPGVELDRTQVDRMLEGEPQLQPQTAFQDTRRHAGITNGAEQDRVVPAQLVEHTVGQCLAGAMPPCRAKVVRRGLDLDVAADSGVEHLQALGDDFATDAVAGYDCKPHQSLSAFSGAESSCQSSDRCTASRACSSVPCSSMPLNYYSCLSRSPAHATTPS